MWRVFFVLVLGAHAPAALAQAPTKLSSLPEVMFASETGNCPLMAKVDHARAAQGRAEIQVSLIDAKADATCACKTAAQKIALSRVTRLGTQAPETRELSARPLKRNDPAKFFLKQTISAQKGSETYWLRVTCGD
jgi:hypothetical protein